MFYAVLALAASRQVGVSKHTQAVSFLDKEFVREGIFSPETSIAFHVAFDERHTHDYAEIRDIEYEEAQSALTGAKSFVKTISDYLKEEKK